MQQLDLGLVNYRQNLDFLRQVSTRMLIIVLPSCLLLGLELSSVGLETGNAIASLGFGALLVCATQGSKWLAR